MLYPLELQVEIQSPIRPFNRSTQTPMQMHEAARPSTDDIANTARLFRLFLGGDDAAFVALYELHNQKIFIYCTKILKDSAAAKDMTHSVWEKVIALRQQQSDIQNPTGFFLRMARNLCYDYQKHLRFQESFEQMPEAMHPITETNELSDTEQMVVEALDELPEQTREIIVLHYYSGYSFEEIAEMMDKTPNAIWTRVSRARAELKNSIAAKIEQQRLSRRNN